jgi:putative ABC transport system permease protein
MSTSLHNTFQDLKYATRTLRRAPSFTLAVVLTLALGIGANAAVFAVIHAVLLRPPPYERADELIVLNHRDRRTGITKEFLAVGDYFDLQRDLTSVVAMGSYGSGDGSVYDGPEPIRVGVLSLAPGAFRALSPRVVHGRGIEEGDARNGAAPVMLLGHELWMRQYRSDPAIVGRTLRVENTDRQVIGIVESGFSFPPRANADVIIPVMLPAQMPANRRAGWTTAVARLKPEATLSQTLTELQRLSTQYERDYPASNLASEYFAISLRDMLAGNARTPLLLLFGAVGVLLLIACANVANLVLARSLARRQEMSVRIALGASRSRMGAQLLAENLVLALVGGLVGAALAQGGASGIAALVPDSVGARGVEQISVNAPVMFFALGITLLTALALGAVSILAAHRRSVRGTLVDSTRMSMNARARRSASSLIVAEVALALVLLVGAGLILRTFGRLMNVDPGFRIDRVLTLEMQLPAGTYQHVPQREAFYERAFAALAAVPGVDEVGAGVIVPLTGNNWTIPLDRMDRPVPEGERPPEVGWQVASRGFFNTLGIRLVSGRLFDAAVDRPESPPVVIVSEAIRQRYFDGQDPVGKQIRFGQGTAEIVGVVSDIRRAGLRDEPRADMYLPFERNPSGGITLFLRTSDDPLRSLGAIRAALRGIEPRVLLLDHATLERVASESVRDTKLVLWLLGLFAATALALAAVGIYGVTAYVVRQRTREIGARIALGATPGFVVRLVLRDSLLVAGVGVAIGLAVTFVATRLLSAMLFGVGRGDPASIVGAAAIMVGVAAAASLVPAVRASRVDPITALRSD